jgi:uncharacterized protein (TIGR02271 family)
MNNSRATVVGVFESRDRAEDAIAELHRMGFRDEQIGFAMKGGDTATGTTAVGETAGSAGTGAATGAVLGGLLGAAAALLIPGVGPVLAIGTLGGTVLAGAAAGAGLGALAGALVGMGVPEEEARYYEGEFHQGRAVVTVHADARAREVEETLRRFGAYDVNNRQPLSSAQGGTHEHMHAHDGGTEMHSHPHQHAGGQVETHDHSHAGAGMADTDMRRSAMAEDRTTRDVNRNMNRDARMDDNAEAIRLREEQLKVNKERVQTGEVEIGKRVVEEQRSMNVPVSREEVVVERRPVNEPTDKPVGSGDREINVPVMGERVDVDKQAVVTEEIGVSKRVEQANVPVNETVRREEPVIKTNGDVNVRGDVGSGMGTGTRSRWEDVMPTFRSDWQRNYGTTGRWEDYEPGYRYGWEQYNSGRWSGKSWTEVEPEFRRDWSTRYPNQSWDRASNPIKHAWDHLTGSPHTHTR